MTLKGGKTGLVDNSIFRRIKVARGEEPADILFKNCRVADLFCSTLKEACVAVAEGAVVSVGDGALDAAEVVDLGGKVLAPSFIDAHIHIESSMLTPEGFAEAVVPHGTGATVSDPHEIANVLGLQGLEYMKGASRGIPMDIFYTVPSCVPATHMETAGAELGPDDIKRAVDILGDPPALSEMMNFPGVIFAVPEVLRKLAVARELGLLIDGHSPGLRGKDLDAYLSGGISTDHECLTADEALEKLRKGMWVLMREGSAAKNLRELIPAVDAGNAHRICIASDDRHPDDLVSEGHLDHSLRVAVGAGLDPMLALRMVTLNPATLYRLEGRGAIAPGYRADLVVLEDMKDFRVASVYRFGAKVAEDGKLLAPINRAASAASSSGVKLPADLRTKLNAYPAAGKVRVIGVSGAQIVTSSEIADASDAGPSRLLQFAAVVERHRGTGNVGLAFVKGFGLKAGALASTVAHDSHNLVMVGTSPVELESAANAVAEMGGGLVVASGGKVLARLPLPVAGLMSRGSATEVAASLSKLHAAVRECGCELPAPFMTLSFIALPVIPSLKLTDRGLVDVGKFQIVHMEA